MRFFKLSSVLLGLCWLLPIYALDETEVITAENVRLLRSVHQINFADYEDQFSSGWFAMDASGSRYLVPSADLLWVWGVGENGVVAEATSQASRYGLALFDAQFGENSPYAVMGDGESYSIYSPNVGGVSTDFTETRYPGYPLSMWLDDYDVWLEVQPPNETHSVVVQLPEILKIDDEAELLGRSIPQRRHPYAPASNPDAVVRIGRIPPPYVITSTENGLVQLWNLQTGDIVVEADNGTGQAAVFGNINSSATQLVWRDTLSEKLYLLNFQTGENRLIADLHGEYVQWFFLTPNADVILGINMAFQPLIVAWDVETGKRTILGEYRQCARPQPDMARLSADGTTLAIGCDSGIDIWRVVNPQ